MDRRHHKENSAPRDPNGASSGKKIILLKPRGFCAGVVRAVDIVNIALECYGPPIYVRKEIVHNSQVVADLTQKGAIFVDSTDEVPEGCRVIFSAHGVSPRVRGKAAARKLRVIDATCPLVTKVHLEAPADGNEARVQRHRRRRRHLRRREPGRVRKGDVLRHPRLIAPSAGSYVRVPPTGSST